MLTNILVGLVAVLHLYFFVLESFLWTKPWGRKNFKMSVEKAETTKVLAVNIGLYNGFLAAGLIWGILHPDPMIGSQVKTFFLACVTVAGIVGGVTVNKRIFFTQSVPAIAALFTLCRFFCAV